MADCLAGSLVAFHHGIHQVFTFEHLTDNNTGSVCSSQTGRLLPEDLTWKTSCAEGDEWTTDPTIQVVRDPPPTLQLPKGDLRQQQQQQLQQLLRGLAPPTSTIPSP